METIFQLLDVDYIHLKNSPILRLFGKTAEGKTVCAFYKGFFPYFYVLAVKGEEDKVVEELKKKFPMDVKQVEEVDRFLPMGFQKSETKILKIILKDPAKTVVVREHLRMQKFVEEIFEADILFKYRFMSDFSMYGMRWYKATGQFAQTKTVKSDITIQADSIEPVEKIENVDLKYLALDIEVIASGTGLPSDTPIAIISLSFFPAFEGKNTMVLVAKKNIGNIDHDVVALKDEKEMLEKFLDTMERYDPDIIVGYNINDFDIPFISERLRVNRLGRILGRCNEKPLISKKIGENRFRNVIVGRAIADPYWMIKDLAGRGFFVGLKRFGLGDVSKFLLGETKIEFSHTDVPVQWKGNNAEWTKKFVDYARKDSELVLKLLLEKGFLDKYVGISRVSGLLLQDSLDTGEAGKVENLLLREFNKENFVLPCRPTDREVSKRIVEREKMGLKGAFVLDPVVGLHTTSVTYLDFASMYASIFISYNICPTTLVRGKVDEESISTPFGTSFISQKVRKGIIPTTLGRLIQERKIVKNQMKKEKDPAMKRALDAHQEALKRIGNAFYGYTGFYMGRIYVLDIANAITSCGRYYIQETKKLIEGQTPYKVIYGDTDSVMIKTDTHDIDEAIKIGDQMAKLLNEKFEGKLVVKVENVFKTLLILTKKRYAGWSFEKVDSHFEDEIIMKGIETVRRDWCDLVSETQENILKILLKEQDSKKAFIYFKDVVQRLQNNQIPLEKLVIIKGISKRLDQYKGVQPHVELVKKMKKRGEATIPGIGERVGFVIVKGPQMVSDRAEDPEYVKKNGLKIDSKYYIESQILPPLERVFEAIGIGKSELIGIGKQMSLADAIRNGVKKQEKDQPLKEVDGFICSSCNRSFRRVPLIGKCECNGEILFYSGENKSRYFSP
jgi:DNA polymerase I